MFQNLFESDREISVFDPKMDDFKSVVRDVFPALSPATRLEVASRILGYRTAAAMQSSIKSHGGDGRFILPAGECVSDDFLDSKMKDDDVDYARRCLLSGLYNQGYLLPSRISSGVAVNSFFEMKGRSPDPVLNAMDHGDRFGSWSFDELICSEIEHQAREKKAARFDPDMFSGDDGRICSARFWLEDEGTSEEWMHPYLDLTLVRAVRNPDIVEWMVERNIRKAFGSDTVRCERETNGFDPKFLLKASDMSRWLDEELSVVRPYLESLSGWLSEHRKKWEGPEEARSILVGMGRESCTLSQARDLHDGLANECKVSPKMMAYISGLSQAALPIGKCGGLPVPDFCLAVGLGMMMDPASVHRPSPSELEDAVRLAAELSEEAGVYEKLIFPEDLVNVLSCEIAVSKERGMNALLARIAMATPGSVSSDSIVVHL